LGNVYKVEDVEAKGYSPLALRYFYFSAGYRKPLNFTWESLASSQKTLDELTREVASLRVQRGKRTALSAEKLAKVDAFRAKFDEALINDLNTPQALAVVWEVVKSNIPPGDKYDLLLDFDDVLGLELAEAKAKDENVEIPTAIQDLLAKREELRKQGKFNEADDVRKQIAKEGFAVKDTSNGSTLVRG
jgi:cysteinyl-tRNA synthetase